MSGWGAGLLLLLLAATSPVEQSPLEPEAPPQTDRDQPQPDEAVGAAAYGRALAAKAPADQIEDLDRAIVALPRPTRFRGQVQCYRGWVLDELGRKADSEAAFAECYQLRPDDPYALWVASSVALGKRDVRRGVRLLLAAIRADPQPLAYYDQAAMDSILRQLAYERLNGVRAELLAELGKAGYGRDDPAWTSTQARDTLDALLASGDRAGAVRMLPLILVPRIGLELLVDRRYQPIWPDIEGWAGGNLVTQRDAYVTAAKAAFDVDPTLARRRNYAVALQAAGRTSEAQALLAAALADQSKWDETRYDIIMIAIRLSGMLEAEGRIDEALRVLRRLKAVTPAAKFAMAANLMPNEARLLIAAGRQAEALKLLDAETPPASRLENRAALGFFTALRICALRGLNREAEAQQLTLQLTRDSGTNVTARQIASGCNRDAADRNQRWIETINDPTRRSEGLLAFLRMKRMPGRSDTFGDENFIGGPLRIDAANEALFNRLGRNLPASFDAALAGWAKAEPPVRR